MRIASVLQFHRNPDVHKNFEQFFELSYDNVDYAKVSTFILNLTYPESH